MKRRNVYGSALLIASVLATAGALAAWKKSSLEEAAAAAANQPEPIEIVTAATAEPRHYRPVTTSIGTVLATRSITLKNELAGTVRNVMLIPGRVVESGEILVALDVAVEQAELEALRAEAALANSVLERTRQLRENDAVSEEELDRAQAARDVAVAQIARLEAVIERKTIRAPFRARVGIADVHPGQYLNEGTAITTLQGIDDAVHVDFAVEQAVLAYVTEGDEVTVTAGDRGPVAATIVAIDARVDPATRNAMVRARLDGGQAAAAPGASVRVNVPAGRSREAVALPANALRKGPEGDHVFVVEADGEGGVRAHLRPVDVLALAGDEVVIGNGIRAGEQVAAAGSFKLREDVLVALANSQASGTGAGR